MEEKIVDKRQSRRDKHYQEAQALYTAGWELKTIANSVPVSLGTLEKWRSSDHWEKKKELVAEHPKLIGEALKGLVTQKVKNLLAGEVELNISNIEELYKIINLIEKTEEQIWDKRAVIIEVMSSFGKFARRQVGERGELQFLGKLMEKFFVEMVGG
jgi:hypothetical protein